MTYFYTYLIEFEDGYYYYGSRKSSVIPEEDIYYNGSPVTNKSKWETTPFKKHILEIYENIEDMKQSELLWIGNNHIKDEKCLNCHNTKNFGVHGMVWYHRYTENGIERHFFAEDTKVDSSWIRGLPSGHKASEEHKNKISKSLTGIKKSDTHKKNLSVSKKASAHSMSGINNVMKRIDIRKKHYEITQTAEYRKNVSDGVKNSDRWTDEKKREHAKRQKCIMMLKNPTSKQIIIDDITYQSIQEAVRKTGMSRYMITKKYMS